MRRRPQGMKLYNYGPPIDYLEYLRIRGGGGANRIRTPRFAQPEALKPGDILATGEEVDAEPQEAGNGGVWVCIGGKWVDIPARVPVALKSDVPGQEHLVKGSQERTYGAALARALKLGDILTTGCEVISPVTPGDEPEEVCVWLVGGLCGHPIGIPEVVPVALLVQEDNAPPQIWSHAEEWWEHIATHYDKNSP